MIHNEFEKYENHPDHAMVDVGRFHSFERDLHNANLFFFLPQNSLNIFIEGIIAY